MSPELFLEIYGFETFSVSVNLLKAVFFSYSNSWYRRMKSQAETAAMF